MATVLAVQLLVGWAVTSSAMPLESNAQLSTFVARGHVVDLHVRNGTFLWRVWRSELQGFGPPVYARGSAVAGVATNIAFCADGDCYVAVEWSDIAEVWHIAFNAELDAASAEKVWSGPDSYCHMLDQVDGSVVMFGEDRVTVLGSRSCRVVADRSMYVLGWAYRNGHFLAANADSIVEWRTGKLETCAPLRVERTAKMGTLVMDIAASPAVVVTMLAHRGRSGSRGVFTLSDTLDPVATLPLSANQGWYIESAGGGVAVLSATSRQLWLITDRSNAIEYERPVMSDQTVVLVVNDRLVFSDGNAVTEPIVKRRIHLTPYHTSVNLRFVLFAVLILLAAAGVSVYAFWTRRRATW